MRRHDELIELAVRQHSGRIVRPRGEGDSRFAVFPRASEALQAAIDIQRRLFAELWTVTPLRVRVALHTGEADLRDGDYYGSTVNRCARLRSAAHGGQILVSQTTYCLVRDELPGGVSLRDLGEHNLKDLERPEHIYQPVVADLPVNFPPLNTPDQIHNNLPLMLTSFIGRRQEIEELEYLVRQARLLTVAGPGGVGKTRLVIQVAQNVLGSFPDGVWFLDLAPLANSALLSQYVMNLLGLREEPGDLPDETLMKNLRSKVLLLILDNCEHLLPAAAQLSEKMLQKAAGLHILATSREKLGAAGEVVWRISPLSSPGTNEIATPENLLRYGAVQLFFDRATAARPDFTLAQENAAAVAQICAHLDGIPLAIELAAARIRVLSVDEIVARLDDRFRLLVGSRTALPRQQTLRALFDWSYDLLTEKEKMLLARLSAFSGGWTLEAAEQVCSGNGVETWEVLDLLTGLIDKSFVIGEHRNGHEHYHFLETILKFSQERLAERQETGEFAQKHAEYFLEIAEESYGKMWGAEQACWLKVLDQEGDNLRTSLEWFAQAGSDKGLLLKMAGCLWRYWEIRGYLTEGRHWLDTALAEEQDERNYWRANGLGGAGHLAHQQGDYEQAKMLHEKSLSIFRSIGCKMGAARQLNALGEIAHFQGDYSGSIELHAESLRIRYEIGDKEGIAVSLRQLGVIARDRGQYQYAQEVLDESLRLVRELGDKLLIALSLNDLALVAYYLCEYERAIPLLEEAISLQIELNDRSGYSNSLLNLGNVAKDQGDFKKAEKLYRECLEQQKDLGDKRGISRTVAYLAEVAFRQGKYHLATDLAGQSLTMSQELGLKRGVLTAFILLGFIAHYQGHYRQAGLYVEKSLVLAEEIELPRASAYAKELSALVMYSEGRLVEARDIFQEALAIFQKINDRHNIASTCVNLARTAYRQGDHHAAMHYLDESLSISQALKIRWTYSFVLEIMGLLQRSAGNYKHSLELFQKSLEMSIEQENQQGIANCLGGLAGLAVMSNQAERAARFFAAAGKLRLEMGARMSSNDRLEYETYLAMVHERLDQATFQAEWSEGATMTTERISEELSEWADVYQSATISNKSRVLEVQNTN